MNCCLRNALALLPLAAASLLVAQSPAELTIHADQRLHAVSPMLYGLMTEEINYSYDGGLYAEMVRNRTLRDEGWEQQDWTLLQNEKAGASMEMDPKSGPSAALTNSLKLVVKAASATEPVGVRNNGFWGYALRPDTAYQASLYARADADGLGPLKVSLVNNQTGQSVASASIPAMGTAWKQYSVVLHTGAMTASANYHLELTVTHPGTLWMTLVSVFPPTYHGRANGNRIDLMEKMAAMHPQFLRFPGGNYLEGNHLADWYDWKKTIGPLVDRPTHPSPWNYHSSDGLGLLEFFEWCEDLHMKPVLAVYAGYSLAHEHIAPGKDLAPYVQDALDEIEYATGGPETKWGAERVRDGHPAPFAIPYVEIGNEDWFDKSGSYEGRFAQFYDALKAKYPAIELIATAPVKSRRPDVLDEHFYKSAEEFFADTHHYDTTDRKGPKIFVGEYATMEGSPTADFGAALGDAAWLTGLERNSDVVVMTSYAPMFVNVNPGGMQWHPDLIGYDGLNSYGSPSYYALAMFAGHLGQSVPQSTLSGAGARVFYSVTEDHAHVIVKLVNAAPQPQSLSIHLDGATAQGTAELLRLHADTTAATNSITHPEAIVPVRSSMAVSGNTLQHTIPGYSVEVLEIPAR